MQAARQPEVQTVQWTVQQTQEQPEAQMVERVVGQQNIRHHHRIHAHLITEVQEAAECGGQ